MGFWHTGYEEFHEAPYVARNIVHAPLPRYCPDCTATFTTNGELETHLFVGHPTANPALLFNGRQCGSTRLQVHQKTAASEWTALNCDTVSVDGKSVVPSEIGLLLSKSRQELNVIELVNGRFSRSIEIQFAIARPADLVGVDRCLQRLAGNRRLTLTDISDFVDAGEHYTSARTYRDGIATYLYGVLARERSPESDLLHSQYRDKFDESAVLLTGIDRPAAKAIRGLISFHYNHFTETAHLDSELQSVSAAHRLGLLLRGDDLPSDLQVRSRPAPIEAMLADAITARVLEFCSIPIDGTAHAHVSRLEIELDSHEPFDQLKLRILASEHHHATGDEDLALIHEHTVGYNNGATKWIQRQTDQREGRAN